MLWPVVVARDCACMVRCADDNLDLLPNREHAVIAIEKLENYVLNNEHDKGKHKAHVFRKTLQFERRHASLLKELIQRSLSRAPAEQGEHSEYGDLWTTWHEIIGLNGQSAIVTVAWMFKTDVRANPRAHLVLH